MDNNDTPTPSQLVLNEDLHALPDLVINTGKSISETTNGVTITDTTHPPTSGNEGIILSQPGLAKTNYSPIVRPSTSNKLNGVRESILKKGVKRKQTTITKMNENNQTKTLRPNGVTEPTGVTLLPTAVTESVSTGYADDLNKEPATTKDEDDAVEALLSLSRATDPLPDVDDENALLMPNGDSTVQDAVPVPI